MGMQLWKQLKYPGAAKEDSAAEAVDDWLLGGCKSVADPKHFDAKLDQTLKYNLESILSTV